MNTPFVTFYSFKGGVGRTMALANVAALMAGRGTRVLMVDVDLEAPGLTWLSIEGKAADPTTPGLVDLLLDARQRGAEADLFALGASEVVDRYTRRVALGERWMADPDGGLWLMPAGRADGGYATRLEELGLGQLYLDGDGEPLIQEFKAVVRASARFDVVFVDSRTGFSDESGVCTRDLADALVIMMGLTRQSREGTAQVMRSLRKVAPRPLVVALSPVPIGEVDAVEGVREQAEAAMREAWGQPVRIGAYIPYQPELAYLDDLRYRARGPLTAAYRQLLDLVWPMIGKDAGALLRALFGASERKDVAAGLTAMRDLWRVDPSALGAAALHDAITAWQAEEGTVDDMLFRRVPDDWRVGEVARRLHLLPSERAGRWYKRAVEVLPNHAGTLGNYALFLADVRRDHDYAEVMYRRALVADPNHANILGNFADFLTDVRGDHDEAEVLYRRALVAGPNHVKNLGNFANFLTDVRGDHAEAEALYRRALVADPNDANNLGNFAIFMEQVRGQRDEAEALYRRAVAANPNHANNLGAFANFLTRARGDHDGAEAMYRRALVADPNHAIILGNFAVFLTNVRGDLDEAEALYRRALTADPNHANNLGNFAGFLFHRGRAEEAVATMDRAFAALGPKPPPDLLCELLFYRYAHLRDEDALGALRAHLATGARSRDWPLDDHVRVATAAGHPAPALLQALVAVIRDDAPLSSLDAARPE
jgi:Tfp pilus assembly protein PilF/cellulose biosynthesis protein BcsQ